MTTIQTILRLVAAKNWEVYQMNVNNAFLRGDLEEEVYMNFSRVFDILILVKFVVFESFYIVLNKHQYVGSRNSQMLYFGLGLFSHTKITLSSPICVKILIFAF